MKIFSAKQLYEADKVTTEKQNISSEDLMERAGKQAFEWLQEKMQGAQVPLHIFCGIGNNGGDGLVVGRLLIEHGYKVTIYVANFTDKRSKCFLINYDKIKVITNKWPVLMTSEEDFPEIGPEDICIDALFGIGLNRAPEGWVKSLIQHINKHSAFTLSIDIPSGLNANGPLADPEAVIDANHTLAFQAPKLAFFLPETGRFVHSYDVLDIGLDTEYLSKVKPLAQLISENEAKLFYKAREKYSHKGTYGHALIVGGSYGKIGAAILAAKATFRAGAGLVTVFVPKCGYEIVQTALPEAMVITDEESDLISAVAFPFEPSAIGIGMGIGTNEKTVAALKKFLTKVKAPILIDADALNCISNNPDLLKLIPKNSILTPHPGELERLIGKWKNDYQKIKKAQKFSADNSIVLIVKGAHTLTIFDEYMYINTSGDPGLATAGSGDVLSGILTGLLSQGYDPLIAAVFGVYLHGISGMLASQKLGYEAVMATDIIDNLGQAYLELIRDFPEEPRPK